MGKIPIPNNTRTPEPTETHLHEPRFVSRDDIFEGPEQHRTKRRPPALTRASRARLLFRISKGKGESERAGTSEPRPIRSEIDGEFYARSRRCDRDSPTRRQEREGVICARLSAPKFSSLTRPFTLTLAELALKVPLSARNLTCRCFVGGAIRSSFTRVFPLSLRSKLLVKEDDKETTPLSLPFKLNPLKPVPVPCTNYEPPKQIADAEKALSKSRVPTPATPRRCVVPSVWRPSVDTKANNCRHLLVFSLGSKSPFFARLICGVGCLLFILLPGSTPYAFFPGLCATAMCASSSCFPLEFISGWVHLLMWRVWDATMIVVFVFFPNKSCVFIQTLCARMRAHLFSFSSTCWVL